MWNSLHNPSTRSSILIFILLFLPRLFCALFTNWKSYHAEQWFQVELLLSSPSRNSKLKLPCVFWIRNCVTPHSLRIPVQETPSPLEFQDAPMVLCGYFQESPGESPHYRARLWKKILGASWLLSFKIWSPAQIFWSPKIFGPSGQNILLQISAVQTVNITFSYHLSRSLRLDFFSAKEK